MSRAIKDIKDKNTGNLIYPRTHVKAIVVNEDTSLEDLIDTDVGNRLNTLESTIKTDGTGNLYLSDDGSYKEVVTEFIETGDAYAEVNHGTSDTTFALTPNTFHVWDEVSSLDLSFAEEREGVANEYLFQFTSGSTATTLTLPDVISWFNSTTIKVEVNHTYQISILNNIAVWCMVVYDSLSTDPT